ncbi:MAG: HAMP domain-containing protein [Acidobacteria bacterium]|nr:HAMP domain-containing protein [Acidobacteriota bacterium]MBU1473743.1 HAMP domain-containing protein [Acidobacteriota bacterium]MBU4252999.1 HAMP domain-containing protein [Acidobacteriota bacterium]
MDNSRKKGPRIFIVLILVLIVLFFTVQFLFREAQRFSPTVVTKFLLFSLQLIVLILFLVLLFVLGRNLIKLYLERRRKVIGSHFKTRLLLFFITLSLIPTLLLFLFASDLISRNIENLFKTPIEKILEDTERLAEGYYLNAEEITQHYAELLANFIKNSAYKIIEDRYELEQVMKDKLKEYYLDEIGFFLGEEELFIVFNSNLPMQFYTDVKKNRILRAHLGESYAAIHTLGNGDLVRRGISIEVPEGKLLVVAGKFLPQSYTRRINAINTYVDMYRHQKIQKPGVKSAYLMTLIFVTLLIIFAASWIAFHLSKAITVPIEKLANATREVSRGNLSVRVEDPASDELGTLIDSFNQMITDIQEGQLNIAQKTSELESRKQFIETILNNITTGVFTLDAEGVITTINPSAANMLGLDEVDSVGKSYNDVLNNSEYSKIVRLIENGLHKSFSLINEEITLTIDDHKSSLALTISPLHEANENFSGMILVFDDLTQLIKAQKLSAWKEVAQRVAHEIKNPLTPIQLSAERIIKNLIEKPEDHSGIAEGAQTIVQEARTIKALVNEFSNFARLPSIKLESSHIHTILEKTIAPFKGIFTEIRIETDLSPAVPESIRIDPEQMRRVFNNLLDNAIDAMNKKGEIRIKTEYDERHKKVIIHIADSGPGISKEDLDKLFLPHFSTKKKGTGLGLAIVNQIISDHNGTIDVTNIEPHGAKFTIQVPA